MDDITLSFRCLAQRLNPHEAVDGSIRVPVDPTPTPAYIFHSSRGRWKFDRAIVYQAEPEMRNHIFLQGINNFRVGDDFIIGVGRVWSGNGIRQLPRRLRFVGDDGSESWRNHKIRPGYDEVWFSWNGHAGGTNKYPGFYSDLSDGTIKILNAEQESFIRATEDLRQTIYEKELYLKAELVKKAPDIVIALSFQNEISETRGIFEQQMIEHIIRIKKNKSGRREQIKSHQIVSLPSLLSWAALHTISNRRTINVTWSNGSHISNTGNDGNNPHMAA